MLKAGLAEGTIARVIGLATERGTTHFDISPQALIELKKQGASPGILDAMISAGAVPQRPVPQPLPRAFLPREVSTIDRLARHDGD